MKKRGGRFLMIVGAGLAAMAFIVVYVATSKGLGTSQASSAPTPVPMVTLAVVNQDVPAYTVLDASNVATIDVEASTAVTPTTSSPASVYGKMALTPMTKGQPILMNQLTVAGFSNVLAKGKRAFTLAVPERSTFGGALTENDYVDVLWTHKYEATGMYNGPDGKPVQQVKELPTTKTLLQDVRVMRVISLRPAPPPKEGQTTTGGQAEATSPNKASPATSAQYSTEALPQYVLILEVSDQQAEVLKFANESGTIDLTLRSSAAFKAADGKDLRGDHDPEKTTGVTDKLLIEQYGLLLPEVVIK